MISFLLTDCEIVDIVRGGIRCSDGRLAISISQEKLEERALPQPFNFMDDSRTVHYGRLSIRFSPKQYALLAYVFVNGRTDFEQLQDVIWNGETSDAAIRTVIARINTRLLEARFQMELVSYHGRVSLERVNA